MAETCLEPTFTLRLVVDEEKKKVVLAEACSDFVDVLLSLVTLPMGTIVRLLKNHRKAEVGCLSNLYKSVVEMGSDEFETEACKEMLLYPRSLRDVQYKRLKLNLHPTESNKLFACPTWISCRTYSNFSSSICRCGKLMKHDIPVAGAKVVDSIQDGVYVRGRSSFIITDDLKVAVRSTDIVLKKLKSVGCGDFSKFEETLVNIGFEEVMTLLQCIFSSNAPLTDTFLNKQSPQGMMKTCETPRSYMERDVEEAEAEPKQVITLSVPS